MIIISSYWTERVTSSKAPYLWLLDRSASVSVLMPFCRMTFHHRWASLLKQQKSITVYRLSTKENKLPVSVFHLQETNGSSPFPFSVCSKQMEVAVFRQLRFQNLYIFKRQHIYRYLLNRRACLLKHIHIHTYTYMYIYTYTCIYSLYIQIMQFQTEYGSPGDCP